MNYASEVGQLGNQLLAALPESTLALLKGDLTARTMSQGTTCFHAADVITRVYFPTSGLISLLVSASGDDLVEAGLIGRHGAAGLQSAVWSKPSFTRAIVQVPQKFLERVGRASSAGSSKERRSQSCGKWLRIEQVFAKPDERRCKRPAAGSQLTRWQRGCCRLRIARNPISCHADAPNGRDWHKGEVGHVRSGRRDQGQSRRPLSGSNRANFPSRHLAARCATLPHTVHQGAPSFPFEGVSRSEYRSFQFLQELRWTSDA